MPGDLISVVIPTYNRSRQFPATFRSVFAQTWRPLELVVVNDGSTDDTKTVIESMKSEAETHGVRFVAIHQDNAGASEARDAGARAATGDWIAWLDDDDFWIPEKLELQMARLRETGADACCGYLTKQLKEGSRRHPKKQRLIEGNDGPAYVRGQSYAHINTIIFKRSLWEEVGEFDPSLPLSQDIEWIARLAFRAKFCAVHEILGTYTYNAVSISRVTGLDRALTVDANQVRAILLMRERNRTMGDWDEQMWQTRVIGEYSCYIKHLMYAGNLSKAGEILEEALEQTDQHDSIKRLRRKLRKARLYALFGVRLRPRSGTIRGMKV